MTQRQEFNISLKDDGYLITTKNHPLKILLNNCRIQTILCDHQLILRHLFQHSLLFNESSQTLQIIIVTTAHIANSFSKNKSLFKTQVFIQPMRHLLRLHTNLFKSCQQNSSFLFRQKALLNEIYNQADILDIAQFQLAPLSQQLPPASELKTSRPHLSYKSKHIDNYPYLHILLALLYYKQLQFITSLSYLIIDIIFSKTTTSIIQMHFSYKTKIKKINLHKYIPESKLYELSLHWDLQTPTPPTIFYLSEIFIPYLTSNLSSSINNQTTFKNQPIIQQDPKISLYSLQQSNLNTSIKTDRQNKNQITKIPTNIDDIVQTTLNYDKLIKPKLILNLIVQRNKQVVAHHLHHNHRQKPKIIDKKT